MDAEQPLSPRETDALDFITSRLRSTGGSPSMDDIAGALKVSRTRAKALVHRLAKKRAINRAPGAQRAISVPGLFEQLVIEKLRAQGWKVDEDVKIAAAPLPEGHLALVAVLDHNPSAGTDAGGGDDDDRDDHLARDARAAAGGASGSRRAPPEASEGVGAA